jgi:phosphoribosylamine--glycine ligase
MKLLIVGSGGREHALLWALHQENPSIEYFAAPGNPGMATLATLIPIAADDINGLILAVQHQEITLTVVGPEVPLALGLVDRLRAAGHLAFGPTAAAARIESSKAYAKELMQRAGVPTASSRTFDNVAAALAYIQRHDEPLVVKASGLAAGKGAVVCANRGEAISAVREMMDNRALGDAGRQVVIEEFMRGEELSVFALTDGREVVLLPSAQDHKRLLEGDQGPNTGGMGAYSPVSLATVELLSKVTRTILTPTLAQMEREGARFSGLLYAGLMIEPSGTPRVVEFNCRFGDPETQVILPLIESGLLSAIEGVARGLPPSQVRVKDNMFAVTTVLAAKGYPEQPERGAQVFLPTEMDAGTMVFHAGTRADPDGTVRVAGGRVAAVTGLGLSFTEAQAKSRKGADAIQFEGKVFRRDIGWREAERIRGATITTFT